MSNLKTTVTRRQSTSSFPKNEHFLPSDMQTHERNVRCAYQGVRNFCFSENLACFVCL